MFDISWGKLVIIGVVALLVIGPKELPGVLRMLGQYMGKMRRMASEFQGQFQEAMREAEMADLKKQFDDTTSSFQSAIDPSGLKSDIEKMIQDPVAPLAADTAAATSTPATPPSGDALATPATATPEATAPSDPVALGTAPVAPAVPASDAVPPATADLNVPMPELPPPIDPKDFAPASAAEAAPAPAVPAAEGGKAA
jgi:sec-independent protein translocase protein TatB